MTIISMTELDLRNKRVMIREDLNVPLKNGVVTSDARLHAVLPTINQVLNQGGAVILLSHLGRPIEGVYDSQFSLQPVAQRLSQLLAKPIRFEKQWLTGIDILPGEIVLCENVRFNPGEKANDEKLAQQMAKLCDVFVMDAFATAHRAEASTVGVAQYAPVACAGPLLCAELQALAQATKNPQHPVLAIVGGSKVSGKLEVLTNLIPQVDYLIVGGGIANTFLAAQGISVGKSLYEPDLIQQARDLLQQAQRQNCQILLPTDVTTATEFSETATAQIRELDAIHDDDMILDIGPKTAKRFAEIIAQVKTIIWNGPVGVFEFEAFSAGTKALSQAIAHSTAFSIAGGGDTLAAIDQYHIAQKVSYISTGGGAFLEFLQGITLPAVAALQTKEKTHGC